MSPIPAAPHPHTPMIWLVIPTHIYIHVWNLTYGMYDIMEISSRKENTPTHSSNDS